MKKLLLFFPVSILSVFCASAQPSLADYNDQEKLQIILNALNVESLTNQQLTLLCNDESFLNTLTKVNTLYNQQDRTFVALMESLKDIYFLGSLISLVPLALFIIVLFSVKVKGTTIVYISNQPPHIWSTF